MENQETKDRVLFNSKMVQALVEKVEKMERETINPFQIPKGMIALWDKPANEIPVGWVEYKNLAGRVPVGIDGSGEFNELGKVGGDKVRTLTVAQMPAHNHQQGSEGLQSLFGGGNMHMTSKAPSGSYPFGNKQDTSIVGGNQAFSILNPYRVVQYIQYVGIDEIELGKKKVHL